MKNIFETLNEKGICYAVSVALIEFKSTGSGLCDRDYSVIIAKADLTKQEARKLKFYDNKENYYELWERDLSDEEIRLFKDSQNDFVKVQHNKHGRMYELKNNSFKKYYGGLAKNKVCTTVD